MNIFSKGGEKDPSAPSCIPSGVPALRWCGHQVFGAVGLSRCPVIGQGGEHETMKHLGPARVASFPCGDSVRMLGEGGSSLVDFVAGQWDRHIAGGVAAQETPRRLVLAFVASFPRQECISEIGGAGMASSTS
jgi:hypothetical protein